MDVRFAAAADIPDLIRLRFDFFDADPVLALTAEQRALMTPRLQGYYEKHLNRDFFAALAIADGRMAAGAFLVIHEKPPNYRFPTGKTGEILNVFTYVEHRLNGLATAALRLLIAKAKEENVSFLELSATSAGKPVYEKLGFTQTPPGRDTDMILKML